MDFSEFEHSVADAPQPPAVGPALRALWHEARGEWGEAHRLAQATGGADGAWVHAYLHRREGDLGNASHWYARAGKAMPDKSLEDEWEAIARALLRAEAGPG